MKDDQKELIAQAIKALRIRDVMLNGCSFKRPNPPPADAKEIEVKQLTKRTVRYVLGDGPMESGQTVQLLQVFVSLGIRILGAHKTKPPVYFEIEADFLVEYDVKKELSEAAIKAFADNNSVHNVWPFWRQHVFDAVSRGRLPHLEVPLFSVPLFALQAHKKEKAIGQKSLTN
jgi:preprotein translocase subunit SecB